MKKNFLMASILSICIFNFATDVYAQNGTMYPPGDSSNPHEHIGKFVDEDKLEDLVEKGFTRKEIFIASHIAKKTNQPVENVLSFYKKNNNSWETTAKHFGVNLEDIKKFKNRDCAFYKKNEAAIILSLADYTDKKPEEIKGYIKDDISLRFLVAAAAISELSGKSIEEIIKLKQQGQSLFDISQTLKIDHKKMHEEIKEIIDEVKPEGNESE